MMSSASSKIIAVIPARYHSSRFTGKPLARICGKPMIQHVVERAMQVPLLSQVVVATDDERIAQAVADFGGAFVMTNANHASGTDRLAEAADILGLTDQDVVINIQGDQPLYPAKIIEQMARPLIDDPELPMSTLIYKIVQQEEIHNPNHVKTVFDHQYRALYFSRAPIPYQRDPQQSSQPIYYKHLGFYAYRKKFLQTFVSLPQGQWECLEKLEQLRALEYGYTIRVVLTEYDSIEVDTPEDALQVERILNANCTLQATS